MMHMLGIEIRRCFARRLVRWLIVLAVVGCVVTAFVAHRAASHAGRVRPVRSWSSCTSRRAATPSSASAAFFLVIGAVVGGASMIGAEWRAGTFVTLLTWEPNRRRVAIAKLLACGLVATAIAVVLQVLLHRGLPPRRARVPARWTASTPSGGARWRVRGSGSAG